MDLERGSMAPLVALVILLAGASALALGRIGGAAAARADAQTAADAAALAGAAEGRPAAQEMAEANGGRLLAFERMGDDTRVVVELGPAQATGRARRDGADRERGAGAGGAARREDLAPAMRAALARAEQLLGRQVPITSGYRTRQDQERLFANRASNPYPVAAPGTSMHERGLAIDVPSSFVSELKRVAPDAGLCQPFPVSDPVHFEVCK